MTESLQDWLRTAEPRVYQLLTEDPSQRAKQNWGPWLLAQDAFEPLLFDARRTKDLAYWKDPGEPDGEYLSFGVMAQYRNSESVLPGAEYDQLWRLFGDQMRKWSLGSVELWIAQRLRASSPPPDKGWPSTWFAVLPRELWRLLAERLAGRALARADFELLASPTMPPHKVQRDVYSANW